MSKRREPTKTAGREPRRAAGPLSPERQCIYDRYQAQLKELLATPGLKVYQIAEMLGARAHLKSSRSGAIEFDVDGFIRAEMQRAKPLRLPDKVAQINRTILPSGIGEIVSGTGEGMDKSDIIPRTEYLMEVLTSLNLPYEVVNGQNTPEMVRTLSYQVFIISGIGKAVLVCNEEGNATFVLHQQPQDQSWAEVCTTHTKDELKEHIPEGNVSYVEWSDPESWKAQITALLQRRAVTGAMKTKPEREYKPAPDGWVTRNGIVRLLGKSVKLIVPLIDKHRARYPDSIQPYRDAIGHVREHYGPSLIRAIKKEIDSREQAPNGWLNLHSAARKLGVSRNAVNRFVATYRASHPDWFKQYITDGHSGGQMTEHFSPELVALALKEYSSREKAPEGWMTRGTLAGVVQRNFRTVDRVAARYQGSHSQWFQYYIDNGGNPQEHLAPELCAIIKVELTEHESAPEGWITRSALSRSLHRGHGPIEEIAERFSEDRPEWLKVYNDIGGQPKLHYSPELAVIIRNEIEKEEVAPEGWVSAYQFATQMGRYVSTVLSRADELAAGQPDLMREYRTAKSGKGARMSMHFAPELMRALKECFEKDESAPPGWLTAEAARKKVGLARKTFIKRAERYRAEHPEWFADYLTSIKQKKGHYSPDLIRKIEESSRATE